ncbi:Box C/D snoRNA protein 1 [Chamberlinius hualienensis]
MMCSICSVGELKYKCPKCEVRTCSLNCVKKHKEVNNCDGIRSETEFIPLNKFSETNTLNDFRFLENITRSLETSARAILTSGSQLNYREQLRLVNECRNRGCFLKLLKFDYPRRQKRIPYLNIQERKIYWNIKWIFEQSNVNIESEKVPEDLTLGEALEPLLLDQSHQLYDNLRYYVSASFRGIIPLMRVPCEKGSKKMYEVLDFGKSITSNLYGKGIVEYPIIYLILSEHKHIYLTDENYN